jgi:hypothetical protein
MTGKTSPASKLVSVAARRVLRPLGLSQKGSSRTWLDDHGWWVGVVEFQPGRSAGSYLNVGCMWLWVEKDYVSFDEGNRVEKHAEFQAESQFEAEATRLADRAAEEILRYRRLFDRVEAVGKFYLAQAAAAPGSWKDYHAGVACALSGKTKDAVRFFDRFLSKKNDRPQWLVEAQEDAERLKALAGDRAKFRDVITQRVQATRELQKLPKATKIDFEEPVTTPI